MAGQGQFFEPTVLALCNHSMSVMTEEIFGPVVPFQRVFSDDEAVALANDSHLGLSAYVFTSDRDKGERLARRIHAGSVVINDVFLHYATVEAPFGAVKKSGFGRVHGDEALREMADTKHVFVGRLPEPASDPTWFPYAESAYDVRRRILQALYGGGGVVQRLRAFF